LILVDTNVLSETSRRQPDPEVVRWLAREGPRLRMSAIALAELRYGVEKLDASRQRTELERWLARLTAAFDGRILSFDARAAEAHGRLRARLKRIGKPMDAPDSYVAAIAISLGIPLATRNVKHFERSEVDLIDPWTASGPP
jgi:predicted nucleic acid-binding protein